MAVGVPVPVAAATRIPVIGGFVNWFRSNLLVAPALIYAIVITQAPFLLTIWFSLQKWNLLRPENSRFAGIDNFVDLFRTNEFLSALVNTVVLTGSAVTLSLVVGLFYAELINHRFPGRGIVRTLLITPFLVMPVVGALGWKNMMLNPVFGVVDWLTTSLGGPRIDWFAQFPLLSIIVIVVWRWAPFMMLILLAGMQSLSDEVREAGRVDGVTTLQEFRFIVLPHLRRYMQLGILLGTIYILSEFDSIAMTTQGGPGDATMNLPYLIYRTVFYAYDVGHAAAMGVVVVVITYIFATFLIRMLGRLMEGNQ
jgi:sorbitol/mannitol transport system permease protein